MTKTKKRALAIGLSVAAVIVAAAVYLLYGAQSLTDPGSMDSIRAHLMPNLAGDFAVLADETSGNVRAVLFSGPSDDELHLAVFQKHPLYANRYKVVTQTHGDTAYFSEKIFTCTAQDAPEGGEELLCFAGTGKQGGTYSLFSAYSDGSVQKMGTLTLPDGPFVQLHFYADASRDMFTRSGDLTAEQAAADRANGVQDNT